MTDFIMTMLSIALLNVFFGTLVYILLIFLIKKIEERKARDKAQNYNAATINIRDYSEASIDILQYLAFGSIGLSMPDIKKTQTLYLKRKLKRNVNRHRPYMRIHASKHNFDDNDSLTDILMREYSQDIFEHNSLERPFEFHRLAVAC